MMIPEPPPSKDGLASSYHARSDEKYAGKPDPFGLLRQAAIGNFKVNRAQPLAQEAAALCRRVHAWAVNGADASSDLTEWFRETERYLHSGHAYAADVGMRAIVRLSFAHPDRERWILQNFKRAKVRTKRNMLRCCVPRSPEPGDVFNELIRIALQSHANVRRDAIRLIGIAQNVALIDDQIAAAEREPRMSDRAYFLELTKLCRYGYVLEDTDGGDRWLRIYLDFEHSYSCGVPIEAFAEGNEHEVASRVRTALLDENSEDAQWFRTVRDAATAQRLAEDPDYMTRQPPEFVDESDPVKRRALVQWILKESKANNGTAFVGVDQYFDGNLNEGSIGCNIAAHPGISVFWSVLKRIAARS
ncbi:MAG: hypothetical protein K2X32_11000, partial [Phycisphaerales bacterium]|nr:hypothetical protein [Phycisphaerales bacterium]